MAFRTALLFAALAAASCEAAVEIVALPEYHRPDPFGGIVEPDRGSGAELRSTITLRGARGGYVSCHLIVKRPEGGAYSLALESGSSSLDPELYREWFHFTDSNSSYYPDALIPVASPYRSQLPEPDNKVPQQTAQAFWLDVWIPKNAVAGSSELRAVAQAGGSRATLSIRVEVINAAVPDEDAVVIDHNSYGSSWIEDAFPQARGNDDGLFRLIHAYHRIFYEHRGVFHQLGYGHGGRVGREFAPVLEGTGRKKHIADWSLFDRHYGPLFDGSAFATTHRGARPIPFVYLPINPEWPASFLWWGEPGYETEFVSVVSAMERHFREKRWTGTRFELFFNHKKRYKAFPFDGDEVRFPSDLEYFKEYGRLLRQALPSATPAKFVFRADVSWMMERQFQELAGVVNFWVCGGTELAWYEPAVRAIKQRGDIVWFYGSAPPVTRPASAVTSDPLKAWMWGIDGYVHWLAVAPGEDPWFHFDGGGTALVYPGERFGLAAPIPSVRLKVQRNAVQDIDLLDAARRGHPLDQLKAEVSRLYNGSTPRDWWTRRPPIADRPPWEWNNADIGEAPQPNRHLFGNIDPAAWRKVREYALQVAEEK
jgi:hypothetical protein